jgi:hypothetical protein
MGSVVRIVIIIYCVQAAVGFAAGFAFPWLRFFSVI